jgi:hypothetical protein
MRRSSHSRDRYFAWNGVVLVMAGVILLLDRLGVVPMLELLRFWPVVAVAIGTVLLVEVRAVVIRTIGGVLIANGMILLAGNLGYLGVRGELFWPLILIDIGAVLMARAIEERNRPVVEVPPKTAEMPEPPQPPLRTRYRQTNAGSPPPKPETPRAESAPPPPRPERPDFADRFWDKANRFCEGAERFARNLEAANGEHVSVFGHVQRHVTDQNLQKMRVVSVFGGFQLDLRDAGMQDDQAVVDTAAVFGGIEVIVPDDWQVVSHGAGIFGGFTDETRPPDRPTKRLIVTGAGVFGGVIVTNKPGFWGRHHHMMHERMEERMQQRMQERMQRMHERMDRWQQKMKDRGWQDRN